jgi:hypothetical protein
MQSVGISSQWQCILQQMHLVMLRSTASKDGDFPNRQDRLNTVVWKKVDKTEKQKRQPPPPPNSNFYDARRNAFIFP